VSQPGWSGDFIISSQPLTRCHMSPYHISSLFLFLLSCLFLSSLPPLCRRLFLLLFLFSSPFLPLPLMSHAPFCLSLFCTARLPLPLHFSFLLPSHNTPFPLLSSSLLLTHTLKMREIHIERETRIREGELETQETWRGLRSGGIKRDLCDRVVGWGMRFLVSRPR
jgi:hypothetical protein